MKDLLVQYKKSRKGINDMLKNLQDTTEDEVDKTILNDAYEELSWIIEWLENGSNPQEVRGINIKHAYDVASLSNMDILPDLTEQLESEPPKLTGEQKRTLTKIFKNLSNRERDCFILHHGSLMSMQEIADELGIGKRTVQQYIERARGKIKNINL